MYGPIFQEKEKTWGTEWTITNYAKKPIIISGYLIGAGWGIQKGVTNETLIGRLN